MKKLIFIFLLFSFIACRPYSKEAYLKDYESFINEISLEEQDYTEKDWTSIESKFDKFNTIWYNDYSDEFSLTDKLKVTKLKTQYLYYRGKVKIKGLFKK
jgi:hypothetical protein